MPAIVQNQKPDVIIIGSGVGGATIAHSLISTGAKILMLERGDFLPNEPQNSDAEAVFVQSRYRTKDIWRFADGRTFRPGQYYHVGGHTKFYGTAMFRFREKDFEETQHEEGVSPAWPISYSDLEPYYTTAEKLFGVRGQAGDDPTEPFRSEPYPHAASPHEPLLARLADGLAKQNLHPFHMPSAIDFGPGGTCRRCGTCDAFACRFDAKGDAETRVLRPLLSKPNMTLVTGAKVLRLIADAEGKCIAAVEYEKGGEIHQISAPLIVLSAGAINSALLLQRSADEKNPNGLANSSGVVGKYLMNHHLTGLMGVLPFETNTTRFTKTLSIMDFYFGSADDPAARGNMQMLGNIQGPMIKAAYPNIPRLFGNWLAEHSVDWLVMSEDPPSANNKVTALPDGGVEVNWQPPDIKAHGRMVRRAKSILRKLGFPVVLEHTFGIDGPSHQCGTVRMGHDPKTAALNSFCQAYDHPNLYVVDTGFFSSSAAVNPALTLTAQALRVGDHLRQTWFDAVRN